VYPKYSVDIGYKNTSTAPTWLQVISELLVSSGSLMWLIFPLYEKLSGKSLYSFEKSTIVIYKKESILGRRLVIYEEIIPPDTPHHLLSKTRYRIKKDLDNGEIETVLQSYLSGTKTIF